MRVAGDDVQRRAGAPLETFGKVARHGLSRLHHFQVEIEPWEDCQCSPHHDRRNNEQPEPGSDDDMLPVEANAFAGGDYHEKTGEDDERRNPSHRCRPPDQHGQQSAGEGRHDCKEVDELPGESIDRRTHEQRRRIVAWPGPSRH